MSFNPLKNKTPESDIPYQSPEDLANEAINSMNQDDEDDGIVNYEHSTIAPEAMSYEGEKVTDLQETGLKTEELLNKNIPKVIEKQKFNLPLLESLPLSYILEQLGATKKKDNLYSIYGSDISIKEDSSKETRWYNTVLATGKVNAISLAIHLLALKNNINAPQENKKEFIAAYIKEHSKMLFISACKELNELQNNQTNIAENVAQYISTPTTNTIDTSTEKKKGFSRTPEEHKAYWKELTDQLNSIDLKEVMEHYGATPNEDRQPGKWKMHSTGDNIQITGQQWKSWKTDGGGIGAISLVAWHLSIINSIDTRTDDMQKKVRMMAIKELISVFGDNDLSQFAAIGNQIAYKVPFAMPYILDSKINHVRTYLNEKRGLPLWIIEKQIKTGSLYAGFPSDWTADKNLRTPEKLTDDKVWAVFLSKNATAAEMRAIDRTDNFAKMLAKGSDKELGGFFIKHEKDVTEKTVTALEASIDAMSYHAIYPGRYATSCMGVNFNLAVTAAIECLSQKGKFQLAFDNDQAGNEAAVRFREGLIAEIGEEEYQQYAVDGKLGYFDLGLRCLEEAISLNQKFYLDVQDNPIGIDVVKLFQDQAIKKFGRDQFKETVGQGFVKYLNVCPSFSNIVDIEKEAKQVLSKITSGKPYYLRIRSDDEEDTQTDDVNKEKVRITKELFLDTFEKLAGEQYSLLKENGSIIYNKEAIAKDWNEYYIYLKENKPEFKEYLNEQEKKYAHYSIPDEIPITKKKSKRM